MRAELKTIFSLEVDDLAGFSPDDPSHFSVTMRLICRPADDVGEESFDVTVCSPSWIAQMVEDHRPRLVRHRIVIDRYDWVAIEQYIRQYVNGCSGSGWAEVAAKLARLGHWEFEDYQDR